MFFVTMIRKQTQALPRLCRLDLLLCFCLAVELEHNEFCPPRRGRGGRGREGGREGHLLRLSPCAVSRRTVALVMRMQVASGYNPRGPQPPPSRAPPAAQHLEEASEGEVDTGVFAEQRQLRNRQRKLIIDVHEEVKCERRRAESQLRREGVLTKDNEGNPSDAEWRAILQTVVSPGSYMDRDRRELDVMDEDRDYVEDMETAIRYGFSTIQSHLESQYAIEAPPLQARSLMHDNDEQFPQAEQLPVTLDRKEGGLAAKDPRPTVTARVGDFTLPMPVFAHGELREALTSLRNSSGGASAGGARNGAVDASKKTRNEPSRLHGDGAA